jgi:hypothetical protein
VCGKDDHYGLLKKFACTQKNGQGAALSDLLTKPFLPVYFCKRHVFILAVGAYQVSDVIVDFDLAIAVLGYIVGIQAIRALRPFAFHAVFKRR